MKYSGGVQMDASPSNLVSYYGMSNHAHHGKCTGNLVRPS